MRNARGTHRTIGGLLLLAMPLLVLAGCHEGQPAASPSTPPAVEVADVLRKDVPVYSEWLGTLDGSVNATIRAQVQGYLVAQHYKEGDFVRKGAVLFEIDARPFQATAEEVEAALTRAQAALVQARAALEQAAAEVARQEAFWVTARANLSRVKPLADDGAVSQKDLDDAVGSEQSARAALAGAKAAGVAAQAAIAVNEASVAAAKASAARARLDLGFTRIVAPVDGIAGIAKAQTGNLVGPGSVDELTTVSTVDPIKVYVPLSEQEYMKSGDMDRMPLSLILADGSVHPQAGRFAFADRQVDVRTGTIKVAALFANPRNFLRPGQFARVRALARNRQGALLIPQRAVAELQGGYQVAVLGAGDTIEIRPVKLGERDGSLWIVEEGLAAGERVVAEGIQKVKQGMRVSPKPFVPAATGEKR